MTDPFVPPPPGAAPPPAPEPPAFGEPLPPGRANGLGTASLVLGIVAIPFCWLVFPGVLAVVLGFVGRARARRGEASNGGSALWGIITGSFGLVLSVLLITWLAQFAQSPEYERYKDCDAVAQTNDQKNACADQLLDELFD